MGRLRLLAGALGIIVGFFVYEYGLFLTLGLSILYSWSVTFLPWIESSPLAGPVLQLAGGVLAIAGLLICITWVGSQAKGRPTRIEVPRASEASTLDVTPLRRCKFCQAVVESDAVFCPQCQRAQV